MAEECSEKEKSPADVPGSIREFAAAGVLSKCAVRERVHTRQHNRQISDCVPSEARFQIRGRTMFSIVFNCSLSFRS